jgi:hypothetical protein
VNVPSKAFGEWVEHRYGTPSVSAEELRAMQQAGEDMVTAERVARAQRALQGQPA